jgi:hypothetical protein
MSTVKQATDTAVSVKKINGELEGYEGMDAEARRREGRKIIRTEHGQHADNCVDRYRSRYSNCLNLRGFAGEPCRIRTGDPLLKRQMLYRLS